MVFIWNREQFNKFIDSETKKYQKKYGFEIGTNNSIHDTHNNEADAFKHAFMQSWLAFNFGKIISKTLGDWHEYVEGPKQKQPKGEFDMDLWNNKAGREISDEIKAEGKTRLIKRSDINDLIAEKIMQRMRAGQLITKPGTAPKNPKGMPTGFASSISFDNEQSDPYELRARRLEELMVPQNERIKRVHEMINNTSKEKANSSGPIHVTSYTRSDGVTVKSHYRSRPD